MCCKDHESLAYLRLKPRRMDKSQSQMFISKVIRSSDKETVKKKKKSQDYCNSVTLLPEIMKVLVL